MLLNFTLFSVGCKLGMSGMWTINPLANYDTNTRSGHGIIPISKTEIARAMGKSLLDQRISHLETQPCPEAVCFVVSLQKHNSRGWARGNAQFGSYHPFSTKKEKPV